MQSKGDVEISGNTQGRIANKGMEGLASAEGQTLYGAMQSPLEQDGGTDDGYTRIARVDARTGIAKEVAYPLSSSRSTAGSATSSPSTITNCRWTNAMEKVSATDRAPS